MKRKKNELKKEKKKKRKLLGIQISADTKANDEMMNE